MALKGAYFVATSFNSDTVPSHNLSIAPTAKPLSAASRSFENLYLQEKLYLMWDNWRSQAGSSTSRYGSNYPRFASSDQSPTDQLPLESSVEGKRWGILRTKPKQTENSLNIDKVTDTRENKDKTVFVDRKTGTSKHMTKLKKKTRQNTQDATDIPCMQPLLSAAPPTTPITPQERTAIPRRLERDHFDSSHSAMYFTVDPNWDASKGEAADLFLLTNVTTYASLPKVPQKVASAGAASKPVRKNKLGRSFLTLE